MLKIAIAGVGAMGCLFGVYLAPQTDVIMFGHWPEQIATIQKKRLTLQLPDQSEVRQKIRITQNPADIGKPDILLVVVKSTQTTAVSQELAPFIPQATTIITLQNGLGNLEKITAVFPHNPATSGITALGATMVRPGLVRQAGFGVTHLAITQDTAVSLQKFAQTLNSAGLETHLSQHVDSLVWGKLAINAAINPLTAILQKPNGYLLENETMRALMLATAQEVADLAGVLGINLPYADVGQQVTAVAHTTAHNHSSMYQDIQRGSPTEIDAICGAVIRNGNQLNFPAPLNTQLNAIIHDLETAQISISQAQNRLEILANQIKPGHSEHSEESH